MPITMCLAIPMKIICCHQGRALAEAGGVRREVRTALLESVQPGDYVLVHAGYAITVVDEAEARETLSLLEGVRPGEQAA